MSRRSIVLSLGALLLVLPVAAQAQSSSPAPVKESGSPIMAIELGDQLRTEAPRLESVVGIDWPTISGRDAENSIRCLASAIPTSQDRRGSPLRRSSAVS
jgi:hypothetical protein